MTTLITAVKEAMEMPVLITKMSNNQQSGLFCKRSNHCDHIRQVLMTKTK